MSALRSPRAVLYAFGATFFVLALALTLGPMRRSVSEKTMEQLTRALEERDRRRLAPLLATPSDEAIEEARRQRNYVEGFAEADLRALATRLTRARRAGYTSPEGERVGRVVAEAVLFARESGSAPLDDLTLARRIRAEWILEASGLRDGARLQLSRHSYSVQNGAGETVRTIRVSPRRSGLSLRVTRPLPERN